LADVFWRVGRHGEAREALNEALSRAGPDDPLALARLQARLGDVEISDHRYDAAIAAFDAAEHLLGDHPEHQDQERADLWLAIQLDGRANLFYWRNEPEQAALVLAAARPVVEARGTPVRKVRFYTNLALQQARQSRYRVDDQILANMRTALSASAEDPTGEDVTWTVFCLGFLLLWHGELTEAEQHLQASLAAAERVGDVVLRARSLCYLNVTALRRHDVETVRSLAPQGREAGRVAGYPEYVAAATATMAWVAWKDQRPDAVVALADEALSIWATTVVAYSWYWLCLWPAIATHLQAGRLAEAVAATRQLLVPPQQRLPDELEATVEAAGAAWERGESEVAARALAEALQLAERLSYT
jgi:tetratricopeptide (TPR) repeat protein